MQHLLSLGDCRPQEVLGLLALAEQVKRDPARYRQTLAGKTLGMIFQKHSTRTRVSFEVGMCQLGGHALFLAEAALQISRGETFDDTARVLGRYVDGIMARVKRHRDLELLCGGGVPVINGLSDQVHPCQVLADLLTLRERFGELEGRVLTYLGAGNNMAHSLLVGCCKVGMQVRVATPPEYPADPAVVRSVVAAGGDVVVTDDPVAAATDADALYTDVWVSMGEESERAQRMERLAPYRVDLGLLGRAKPSAVFMHCLPAHRGEEVTGDVIDHDRSVVFDEAENRLHAQKAVLVHLLGGVDLPSV
ncbi:MAG: ornithine carbamoyltransferase [Myxococcales bacterium FL481]|nr:MAG: ornithine carbamoyltransferase [Myxococcales bacterium FL481]